MNTSPCWEHTRHKSFLGVEVQYIKFFDWFQHNCIEFSIVVEKGKIVCILLINIIMRLNLIENFNVHLQNCI